MDDPIRRLPRNALYNAVAAFLPVVVALISTPFILSRLGNEAFGLYLVALSVAGFASLLDLGLGTASIKFVSQYRARGDSEALSSVVNTLLLTRLPQALAVACLGYLGAAWVCRRILAVPPQLMPDAVFVVRVSILTLSVGLIGGSLAALPRALHRFDVASRVGTLHGLLLTAGTVFLLALGYGLREIVLLELLLGVLSLAVSAVVARRLLPEWRPGLQFAPRSLGQLVRFGSLTTLNALAGFVFLHANRILIGRSLGMATVPFFSIPWSLSSRVPQLTSALTEAITPVASGLSADAAGSKLRALYERSMGLTTIVAATILVPLGVGAFDLLTLWLGPSFAQGGGSVLRILALTAFLQSLSAVPYYLLTGIGKPAAANGPPLVAAALNIGLAAVLLPSYGLNGIAFAILAGMAAQALMLIRSVESSLGAPGAAVRSLARPCAAAVVAVAAGVTIASRFDEPLTRLVMSSATATLVQHTLLLLTRCYGLREFHMVRSVVFPGTASEARPVTRDA